MSPNPSQRPDGHIALNEQLYVIERPSARKATVAFRILRSVSDVVQSISARLGNFEHEYRQTHFVEVDRAQARLRYPAEPVLVTDPDGVDRVVTHPPLDDDGKPNPLAGQPVMRESPLDSITEADWERMGHVLRLPVSPQQTERVMAAFDIILDRAEEPLYKLLALMTLTNDEVKEARKADGVDVAIERRRDDLLDDCGLDDLMELAVVVFEVVDDQFRAKARQVGADRLGKALRTMGLQVPTEGPSSTPATSDTSATQTSNEKPTSSTDTPAPTPDGDPTPSSTPLTSSSSDSTPALSGTGA